MCPNYLVSGDMGKLEEHIWRKNFSKRFFLNGETEAQKSSL